MGRLRLVVGISGASGSVYGVRLLEVLAAMPEVESHLVMTTTARMNIAFETDRTPADVEALADVVHDARDLSASIASGSFRVAGMIVAPCSIKTLSAIATSYTDNLLTRAADVALKERRRLVLVLRETPLHAGHCRLLLDAATAGAVILPPVPSFYTRPASIEEIVDQTVGRVLDQFDLEAGLVRRWREQPPITRGSR
ncbi:MAG: UbiX family flavin prenyltransferase [Thermoleophilia bacterium]